jgi:hypothetical protein
MKQFTVPRCLPPTGASPVSVSAGAPSSRPQALDESLAARAGCQKSPRREQARGPQHQVKPAASTDSQSESRAGHVAAKAMSAALLSGGVRVAGLGGVGGAARVHGVRWNTRDPSAQPRSRQRASYKPMAKSSRAQRESEGIVVLLTAAWHNAVRGKGPCFGRARNEGTCQGMAGRTGPNSPDARQRVDNAQQPLHGLAASAERVSSAPLRRRRDVRPVVRVCAVSLVHAASRRPSVSRVPEIGTHGLKGGPALSPMIFTV